MHPKAQEIILEMITERIDTEETDWSSFPDDYSRNMHPVHLLREAYTEIAGGRYPVGHSEKFTNEEFFQYARGRCGWQTQGYPAKFCNAFVASFGTTGSLSECFCVEHCEEALTDY